MKLKLKDGNLKSKVGIGFGGYVPNSLGIKVLKRGPNKHFFEDINLMFGFLFYHCKLQRSLNFVAV